MNFKNAIIMHINSFCICNLEYISIMFITSAIVGHEKKNNARNKYQRKSLFIILFCRFVI